MIIKDKKEGKTHSIYLMPIVGLITTVGWNTPDIPEVQSVTTENHRPAGSVSPMVTTPNSSTPPTSHKTILITQYNITLDSTIPDNTQHKNPALAKTPSPSAPNPTHLITTAPPCPSSHPSKSSNTHLPYPKQSVPQSTDPPLQYLKILSLTTI